MHGNTKIKDVRMFSFCPQRCNRKLRSCGTWGLNQWARFTRSLIDLELLTMKVTCYFEKSGATYPATKTGMLSNKHNLCLG